MKAELGFEHFQRLAQSRFTDVIRVQILEVNATMLHLLGLDHERLTYRFAGRDFRLTDVKGDLVKQILA